MKTVEVLVLESSMASGVAISFDILATANRLREAAGQAPAFAAFASGPGARQLGRPARSGAGIGAPDVLVVPGAGLATEAEVAAGLSGREAAAARRRISAAAEADCEIAASCSSTFLLASAGLLDGRRATTTWWLAPLFRKTFPAVALDASAMVVADGKFTTAGAAMAHINLMLALVARLASPDLADRCARYMLLDRRGSQSPYMSLAMLCTGDEKVAKAEAWARTRLADGIGVAELGAAAGLEPRTFARRVRRTTGLTPVAFLQRLRVEQASELIETTALPIEEIAWRVGYGEPSTLRRLLRRHKGATPRQMRAAGVQPGDAGGRSTRKSGNSATGAAAAAV
jgi:transcriptional regulator GlxA family with amidase domain